MWGYEGLDWQVDVRGRGDEPGGHRAEPDGEGERGQGDGEGDDAGEYFRLSRTSVLNQYVKWEGGKAEG